MCQSCAWETRPPKRRGGEQGGTFDSRKDVNWPASASVCAQQGALAHSPCYHTWLETERWPQAHITASSHTPGQRGDRRRQVGLLGTGAHSKTWDEPELPQQAHAIAAGRVIWEPPAGRCLGMLQIASCAPAPGTQDRATPAPLANEVTADNTSVCAAQEHMPSDVKQSDARSKLPLPQSRLESTMLHFS